MSDVMVMDARDRAALWETLKPFVQRAAPHIQGAQMASLASCIALPMSAEACERVAEQHRQHIDRIIDIKRESEAARKGFVPRHPLVPISQDPTIGDEA